MSTSKNKLKLFGASLALALILMGCGGSSSSVDGQDGGAPAPGNTGGGSNGGGGYTGGGNGGIDIGGGDTTPGGSSGDTTTSLSYDFEITGDGGETPQFVTPKVSTDSILKVTITAGPAGNLQLKDDKYSNFTATYGCVQYKITAGGQSITTNGLNPGGSGVSLCPSAQSSQTINFSSRLSPGHKKISVTVSDPKYDYYCQAWYYGWVYGSYSNYCPMKSVYRNHTVTGSIEIHTN